MLIRLLAIQTSLMPWQERINSESFTCKSVLDMIRVVKFLTLGGYHTFFSSKMER